MLVSEIASRSISARSVINPNRTRTLSLLILLVQRFGFFFFFSPASLPTVTNSSPCDAEKNHMHEVEHHGSPSCATICSTAPSGSSSHCIGTPSPSSHRKLV